MIIKYYSEEFTFEILETDECGFRGILKLDEAQEEKMEELLDLEEENDGWYLDQHGERLESNELFEASPWSIDSPNGEIKLLRRFQNMETEELWLNTREEYGGELFKWIREQS